MNTMFGTAQAIAAPHQRRRAFQSMPSAPIIARAMAPDATSAADGCRLNVSDATTSAHPHRTHTARASAATISGVAAVAVTRLLGGKKNQCSVPRYGLAATSIATD